MKTSTTSSTAGQPPAALALLAAAARSNGVKPDHVGLAATRIDIAKKKRKQVSDLLNQLLADCADLAMRTKHAHWQACTLECDRFAFHRSPQVFR